MDTSEPGNHHSLRWVGWHGLYQYHPRPATKDARRLVDVGTRADPPGIEREAPYQSQFNPVVPAEAGEKSQTMSFLSGMKVFGTDMEKAFAWFGSPKGKVVVAAGEGLLEAAVPASIPVVDLFNVWAQKAYTVESLAVAASQAKGTGADKAVLAISSITPTVLQYAQAEGLPARTTAQIQTANDAAIAFIKAMTEPAA